MAVLRAERDSLYGQSLLRESHSWGATGQVGAVAVLRAEAPAGVQDAQAPQAAEVRQLRRLLILEEAAMESDIRRCARAPPAVSQKRNAAVEGQLLKNQLEMQHPACARACHIEASGARAA